MAESKNRNNGRIVGFVEVHKPSRRVLDHLARDPLLVSALEDIASGRATYRLSLKFKREPKAPKQKAVKP